jgi:quinolinate synthase
MASALAYEQLDSVADDDCEARIRAAKAKLGKRVVILGHHYQRDEVFRRADYSGDSLKLARLALRRMLDVSP